MWAYCFSENGFKYWPFLYVIPIKKEILKGEVCDKIAISDPKNFSSKYSDTEMLQVLSGLLS